MVIQVIGLAINNSGLVTGSAHLINNTSEAFIGNENGITSISPIGTDRGHGISDSNHITGWSTRNAFIYDESGYRLIYVGTDTRPYDINNDGQITGFYTNNGIIMLLSGKKRKLLQP